MEKDGGLMISPAITATTSQAKGISTTSILWAVFMSLLAVLLPHTAWAFKKFEPTGADAFVLISTQQITVTTSDVISYVAAFAFEAAIAVLVHKLAEHLSKKIPSDVKSGKFKQVKIFLWHYVNPISFALIIVTFVSALANLAHAVEFGQPLKIFDTWGIPFEVYTVAFGAILPLLSLTFARVLSTLADEEDAPNPELQTAKDENAKLRKELRESELRLRSSEDKNRQTEAALKAAEEKLELSKGIFGTDKRQRIVILKRSFPALKGSAIAVIAQAGEGYVSDVLRSEGLLEA
jgi:hypothetical protein